jgi:N6-adenosine-specific RNA methylase IME4
VTKLIKYDAACRALAEAKTVDEAKDIRDKAIAMQAYARQARNHDLEADALEIRMRATRRLDQLRQAQAATVGLATGGDARKVARGKQNPEQRPTLDSQGIDKNLAKQARKLGALADEDFERKVGEARSAVTNVVRDALRADDKEARHAERVARLVEASRLNAPLPDRKYPVIYADPPWRYEFSTTSSRSIESHYPTMSTEEICALPVADHATSDSVLFLWVTNPRLHEAFRVLEAWGFTYRTNIVWAKDKIGGGFYVRNQHELLLIAKRGDPPMPAEADRPSSIISAPRREHSRKPDEAYALIERMYPDLPKLELFARTTREGWVPWGLEVDKFDAA